MKPFFNALIGVVDLKYISKTQYLLVQKSEEKICIRNDELINSVSQYQGSFCSFCHQRSLNIIKKYSQQIASVYDKFALTIEITFYKRDKNLHYVKYRICIVNYLLHFFWLIYIYAHTYICFILLKDVDVSSHSHTINGLKKYTEYSFRVVAYNKHGPGVSTQDVAVRTFSDGEFASSGTEYRAWGPWWHSNKIRASISRRFGSHTSSGSVTSVKSVYMS